jgi:hypothetical protein
VEIRSSTCVGGDVRAARLGPRSSRSWTCHARQRLVVRGEDFSREGSSSGKLVRGEANWLKTRCLASEGLDKDLHTTTHAELQVNGGLLLDVLVNKGTTIVKLLASG